MAAQFKHVMLMVENIDATVKFYNEGLGLPIKMQTPGWAELDANGTTIALHFAQEVSKTGHSPILSFHVEDVYQALEKLESMGAKLEGRVREPSFGKVAAVRSPDGHLLSLLQPAPVAAQT